MVPNMEPFIPLLITAAALLSIRCARAFMRPADVEAVPDIPSFPTFRVPPSAERVSADDDRDVYVSRSMGYQFAYVATRGRERAVLDAFSARYSRLDSNHEGAFELDGDDDRIFVGVGCLLDRGDDVFRADVRKAVDLLDDLERNASEGERVMLSSCCRARLALFSGPEGAVHRCPRCLNRVRA